MVTTLGLSRAAAIRLTKTVRFGSSSLPAKTSQAIFGGPYVNAAGIGSLRALSKTGKPVIFTNQYPIEGTDAFWTAYAGVDDFLNGRVAAQMLLDACAKAASDRPLHFSFEVAE